LKRVIQLLCIGVNLQLHSAQLKLLRAMQLQINADTQELYHSLKTTSPAGRGPLEQAIQRVGQTQAQLQTEAQHVAHMLQQGGGQ
ncbi:MAG: hypothetical protein HKL96_13575, partial [Phycisphaerales bacterium]|nr:hypothetical protein [Phycisphaerales bacterium]